MKKYEKILKQIPREELENFLLKSIMQNLSVKSSFEINFSQYFSLKTKKELKKALRNALNMVADRGYISEELGGEFMTTVYECYHKIEDCVKINNIEEAIMIVEATLEVIGEFVIDGSYGEHEDIQNLLKESMENILENCSKEEKKNLLTWLNNYIKTEDEFIDYKDEFEDLIEKYEI